MQWLYELTEDELACAHLIAKIRNTHNGGQSNMPRETKTPGERELQDRMAATAEIGTSRLLNLSWSGCGKGSDGRFDVGDRIEVRSIHERCRGLQVGERDLWKRSAPVVLALVERPGRVELLGWEYIEAVVNYGVFQRADKPWWLLGKDKLRHMETLETAEGQRKRHEQPRTHDGLPASSGGFFRAPARLVATALPTGHAAPH